MREFLKIGYRLRIDEEFKEITTAMQDMSIKKEPERVCLDLFCLSGEEMKNAIDQYITQVDKPVPGSLFTVKDNIKQYIAKAYKD